MKRIFSLILLVFFFLPYAFAAEVKQLNVNDPQPFLEEEAVMQVYFFKVRAQDSFLIVCGGETMLIDAGVQSSGALIAGYLKELGISRIDYAVNTHPHDDHIDGFVPLMEEIEIGTFFVCFPHDENKHMIAALKACEAHGIPVVDITAESEISFGGNTIRLFQDLETKDLNARSLVMHISFGDCTAVFTADITRDVHTRLAEEWANF